MLRLVQFLKMRTASYWKWVENEFNYSTNTPIVSLSSKLFNEFTISITWWGSVQQRLQMTSLSRDGPFTSLVISLDLVMTWFNSLIRSVSLGLSCECVLSVEAFISFLFRMHIIWLWMPLEKWWTWELVWTSSQQHLKVQSSLISSWHWWKFSSGEKLRKWEYSID